MTISNFNKQAIDEMKKIPESKFDQLYFGYERLLEQEAPPPPAPEAPGAEMAPPPPPAGDMGAPPVGGEAPAEDAEPDVVPNKPYPEILTTIAQALTVNLNQDDAGMAENADSIRQLKDFVGEILEGGKVKQMDNGKALRMLDIAQRTINNVVGSLDEV